MIVLAAILVASTSLHITVWPAGQGQPGKHVYTLECAPVAGTLPRRAAACTKLMRVERPFAPTPKCMACTQIYGGDGRGRADAHRGAASPRRVSPGHRRSALENRALRKTVGIASGRLQ